MKLERSIQDARPVLAIDIGGSKLLCAVVDASGHIYAKERKALDSTFGFDEVWQIILQCAEKLKSYAPKGFSCIGVAIPGLADPVNGIWLYSPFSGISNIPVASMLSEAFQTPAFIENDVNACALAERTFGRCTEIDDFLWVTVSNGIGGGVFAGGKLLRGALGSAGEIGHVKVEYDDTKAIRCGCGGYGCVEAMAAGPGIVKRYRTTCPDASALITARNIAALARNGNIHAIKIYEETGVYLGRAIAAAANIVNPSAVILGGGISNDFGLFADALESELKRQIFLQGNPSLRIDMTALGYDAALLGAAVVGYESPAVSL